MEKRPEYVQLAEAVFNHLIEELGSVVGSTYRKYAHVYYQQDYLNKTGLDALFHYFGSFHPGSAGIALEFLRKNATSLPAHIQEELDRFPDLGNNWKEARFTMRTFTGVVTVAATYCPFKTFFHIRKEYAQELLGVDLTNTPTRVNSHILLEDLAAKDKTKKLGRGGELVRLRSWCETFAGVHKSGFHGVLPEPIQCDGAPYGISQHIKNPCLFSWDEIINLVPNVRDVPKELADSLFIKEEGGLYDGLWIHRGDIAKLAPLMLLP